MTNFLSQNVMAYDGLLVFQLSLTSIIQCVTDDFKDS